MNPPSEPTQEQCSAGAQVESPEDGWVAYACWYPQMGGYVGKAVVVFEKESEDYDRCFECFVWHDGEFPFAEGNDWRGPVRCIHHCMPSQFIAFGEFVEAKQKALVDARKEGEK